MVAVIILAGATQMGTPLVAVFFSYFALRKLNFVRYRWISFALFLIVVAVVLYGIAFLVRQAIIALPQIAAESIPPAIAWAQNHGFDLPFSDLESLKTTTLEVVRDEFLFVGNFARTATRQIVFVLIAIVVAISLFLTSSLESREAGTGTENLYTAVTDQIRIRFRLFYQSFETVMGAQLIISAINTTLTAAFVMVVSLKYIPLVIGLTFFCGLLPIVGNLISNSVIVGIGFTESARVAIAALIFLVLLHKLEYFLNSKIIGNRIKNPMWLTLLALVVGERFMGIPGMILAPVVLHYVKVETSRLPPPDPQITVA